MNITPTNAASAHRRLMLLSALLLAGAGRAVADESWVVYPGEEGPGQGKHVVLISGDEEYRSEEALPQLAKILSQRHGFKCTVLFAIDPSDGTISPNVNNNIPGLEALDNADLMIIATRHRDLPDEQMKHIVDYVESGRPGNRHAHGNARLQPQRQKRLTSSIPGETEGPMAALADRCWAKPGSHITAATATKARAGIVVKDMQSHPILRGIHDGDIWGPTDVYRVNLPLPGDSQPLVLGQVLVGMSPTDKPVEGPKNDPLMPIAWVKTFTGTAGKAARVFTTTMGAATDLENEGLRRLLVNASYWAVGLEEKIPEKSNVLLVGEYKPLPYGFNGAAKGTKPSDYEIK